MDVPDIQLETERLVLRPPRIEDFDGYAEMIGDEETARYIGGQLSRPAAWRRFLQMPGAWMLQGYAMFSVLDRQTGEWLGQLGPWRPEGWPGNEVGWSFKRAAWGRGYATEAATVAIDWAFDTLGWTDIIHCIDPDNVASRQLAQRIGSRNLGRVTLPEPFHELPIDAWGQTREQWFARRRGAAA